jgi:integrase/recombinase XerD
MKPSVEATMLKLIDKFADTIRSPVHSQNQRRLLHRLPELLDGSTWDTFEWMDDRTKYKRAIARWLNEGLAPVSVAGRLKPLRRFAKFLLDMELMEPDTCASVLHWTAYAPPESELSGRMLSTDELIKLLALPLVTGTRRAVYAAFWVQLTTGVRGAELGNMKLGDYDAERESIRVRDVKKMSERWQYIPVAARIALAIHRKDACDDIPWLVQPPQAKDNRVRPKWLIRHYANMAEACGVKLFSPHDVRRTTASRLLEQGEDLLTVAKVLGHRSLSSTKRYDHRPVARRREAIKRLEYDLLESAPPELERMHEEILGRMRLG